MVSPIAFVEEIEKIGNYRTTKRYADVSNIPLAPLDAWCKARGLEIEIRGSQCFIPLVEIHELI